MDIHLGKDYKGMRCALIPEKIPNNRFFSGFKENLMKSRVPSKSDVPFEFQSLAVNESFSLIVIIIFFLNYI